MGGHFATYTLWAILQGMHKRRLILSSWQHCIHCYSWRERGYRQCSQCGRKNTILMACWPWNPEMLAISWWIAGIISIQDPIWPVPFTLVQDLDLSIWEEIWRAFWTALFLWVWFTSLINRFVRILLLIRNAEFLILSEIKVNMFEDCKQLIFFRIDFKLIFFR